MFTYRSHIQFILLIIVYIGE